MFKKTITTAAIITATAFSTTAFGVQLKGGVQGFCEGMGDESEHIGNLIGADTPRYQIERRIDREVAVVAEHDEQLSQIVDEILNQVKEAAFEMREENEFGAVSAAPLADGAYKACKKIADKFMKED